jgi:hypothetical protein
MKSKPGVNAGLFFSGPHVPTLENEGAGVVSFRLSSRPFDSGTAHENEHSHREGFGSENPMTHNARDLLSLLIYCCAVAVIGGGTFYMASYAYEATASQVSAARDVESREPRRLDERLASAREVKKALSTPLPPPPLLHPITVKAAHAVGSKIVLRQKPKGPRNEAMDAMAMDIAPRQPYSGAYQPVDRHAVW